MPSHYLNQCWDIVNCTLTNKLRWNFNRNLYIFIQENVFENVVWKMVAILSRLRCLMSNIHLMNTTAVTEEYLIALNIMKFKRFQCRLKLHCVMCCDIHLNPLHAKIFRGTKTYIYMIYTFCVIPPNWHDTGSWNPSSSKTRTYLLFIVNIMGADVLATQGARASEAMIFSMLNIIDSVSAC